MKTLYIHGLDSFPVPEKIKILENAGMEVTALHLDYRTQMDSFQILKQVILDQEIEFIVGSSMGGYIGYWLGEDLGLPCLLFNPAMSFSSSLDEHRPAVENRLCPARFVVIGTLDETVDPKKNIEFFKDAERADCQQRVVRCEWLSHQIDFNTFDEMVVWALRGLQNNK